MALPLAAADFVLFCRFFFSRPHYLTRDQTTLTNLAYAPNVVLEQTGSSLSIVLVITISASALTCYLSLFHLTARQVYLTILIGSDWCRALHLHILESQTPALRLVFLHLCQDSCPWLKDVRGRCLSLASRCSDLKTWLRVLRNHVSYSEPQSWPCHNTGSFNSRGPASGSPFYALQYIVVRSTVAWCSVSHHFSSNLTIFLAVSTLRSFPLLICQHSLHLEPYYKSYSFLHSKTCHPAPL